VFRSKDNGNSWKRIGLEVLLGLGLAQVRAITHFGGAIYMGRIGIFRSPDGEDTWEKVADGFFLSPIQSFAIIEDTIYAGRGGLNPWPVGVYRSDDNGDTWTPSGLKNQHVFSLTVMDTTLYAGTQQGEVFRSENGEESWEKTSLAAPHRIISLEASREALYAGTWSGGVFRSENRGDTQIWIWGQAPLADMGTDMGTGTIR
jgi:photosystem II stability/assembly factor-like uncharacterized protein